MMFEERLRNKNPNVNYGTYRGLEYAYSKDSYEVYDRGVISNERITMSSATGTDNPEACAKASIDNYYDTIQKYRTNTLLEFSTELNKLSRETFESFTQFTSVVNCIFETLDFSAFGNKPLELSYVYHETETPSEVGFIISDIIERFQKYDNESKCIKHYTYPIVLKNEIGIVVIFISHKNI